MSSRLGEALRGAFVDAASTAAKESTELVQEFFRMQRDQRGSSCISLLADDATWWIQGGPPFGGTFDKQQMAHAFSGIRKVFSALDYELSGMTAEGERVAVEVVGKGMLKDGRPWRNTYHFVFIVRGRRIAAVREYMDTGYVKSMFTAAGS
jgi:uncharacterized protein